MDSGNWDCLGSFYIDYENEYLFLNWHYYAGINDIENFVKETHYKPSISTLMLHFNELKIERHENFPFITLRGYALKEKETLQYFKTIDSNANILKKTRLTSIICIRLIAVTI